MMRIDMTEAQARQDELTDSQTPRQGIQTLCFMLGGEVYGVDILQVKEIRNWEPVSRIPNVPFYEKGVVNLRGAIIPIMDLRERFGLEHGEYSRSTVVIVLQSVVSGRSRLMGMVVDSVSDVVTIDARQIQKAPDFGSRDNREFINGLVSVDDRMVMLLDVVQLLKLEEIKPANESQSVWHDH